MPKKTPSKILLFALLIFVLSAGFGGGFVFGRAKSAENGSSALSELIDLKRFLSKEPTFDLLQEGIDVINQKYVDSGKVSKKDLIYGAMHGILGSLDDPYSVFMPPEDAKTFKDDVNGKFEGIGAEIGMRDDALTVISPLKGSPAEKAGLKAGDKILYVDETETKNLSLDEAVKIIRGPKGTKVVLTVQREGVDDDFKISIIRDTIRIPNTAWEIKDGKIAYISLYHFTETASDDFAAAANKIIGSDAEKIVLDLRNNPGGFLEVAVDIAGWFLDDGLKVVTEDHGGKGDNKVYTSHGNAALKDYPLVVLVNKGSASASEILAGVLRDHRGVKLVGEKTFGKGSVQELANLSDRSSIKITVAKWLTPNGVSIQDNGIEPDVAVDMPQKIFDEKGDIQLEKAIEIVKEL